MSGYTATSSKVLERLDKVTASWLMARVWHPYVENSEAIREVLWSGREFFPVRSGEVAAEEAIVAILGGEL